MTTPIRMEKIDPKDYPFRHHIEANKHLDTDEKRGHIQPIVETIVEHYKGQEHLFCDKEQLRDGKFRRPKILVEAEQAGHENVIQHYEAKKRKAEEEKSKESDDLKKQVADLTALVQQLLKK